MTETLNHQKFTEKTLHHPEKVTAMLKEIDVFKVSLGELPPAKKTGKNMDYSPYINLGAVVIGKILAVISFFLVILFFVFRYVIRKIKSGANAQPGTSEGGLP